MSPARFFLSFFAAAILAGCGSYTSPSNPPPGGMQAANGVSIVLGAQNKGTAAFSPNPTTISLASATGGAVKWTNNDRNSGYGGTGVTHTIIADGGAFASGNIAPGGTFQATLTAAGDYPYHCSIHPTMKGTVTVTP